MTIAQELLDVVYAAGLLRREGYLKNTAETLNLGTLFATEGGAGLGRWLDKAIEEVLVKAASEGMLPTKRERLILPITMSAPMILAILNGYKTETRRLAWSLPYVSPDFPGKPKAWQKVKAGDLLWVRESFLEENHKAERGVHKAFSDFWYEATDAVDLLPTKWRSPYHMPRRASRFTLRVTAVKTEPVQNISDEDAIAEGIIHEAGACRVPGMELWGSTPKLAYRLLWQMLHGDESWDANPEVVAITFTSYKINIDEFLRA